MLDGTGAARFRADVAITNGFIVRVGDLSKVRARADIDVRGLMVAPGFINIHSHAVPGVLPTAENMLTQGVTSELLNADGAGPLDIGAQIDGYAAKGLAVNIAASIGCALATSIESLIVLRFLQSLGACAGGRNHSPSPSSTALKCILDKTRVQRCLISGELGPSAEGFCSVPHTGTCKCCADCANASARCQTNSPS